MLISLDTRDDKLLTAQRIPGQGLMYVGVCMGKGGGGETGEKEEKKKGVGVQGGEERMKRRGMKR